jgi:CheY-like chemotaxis protein
LLVPALKGCFDVALRILFADDSMTAQNMGKKILTEAGYEVVAVSNGAAAVKKIAEHKPDIIILDVYMPGYSGLEVCEKVRSSIDTLKTPVLLTVGKMEPPCSQDANRVKADGIIIKPFEASDLLAIVKKLEERIVPTAVPPLVQQTVRLERPPDFAEFAVHSTGNSAPVSVAAIAVPTQEELDENTVQPTVDVPDHMATVSAFSDLLGTDMLSPVEFSAPTAPEPPVEITSTTAFRDPSSTFTSIPDFETLSSFTSVAEAAPSAQELEPSAGLHSDFAVTPELPPALETVQQLEPATVSEPVATQSVEVESSVAVESMEAAETSAEAAEVTAPDPSVQSSPQVNLEGVYPDTQPIPVYEEPAAPAAQVHLDEVQLDEIRLEPAAATLTEAIPVQRDPAFVPTQAEAAAETSEGIEPGLEPTIREQAEVSPVADPNLVTERAALESFPTTFGVQNPEEVPVGIASEHPAFDTPQAGEQATIEAEEAENIEARSEVSSAPASADDDFEARVAAAMNVYAEPAEARVEEAQESDSDKAHTGLAATPEDDFEARVAAAMSAYEELRPTAAFADEMQPAPVHEIAEATAPTEPEPVVDPQFESSPVFHAPVEIPPIQSEPVAVAAEEPASFEYSPPITASRFYPAPQASTEQQIESTAAVPTVAQQPHYLYHDRFAETIQNEPAPQHVQPIADEVVQAGVGHSGISEAGAPEVPQASTQQVAASIEAEMPVEAVAAAAVATGADSDAIAQVVHRVMERIKPELIAAIVRELNSQK